jgi:arsenite methyltransferase
MDAHRIKDNVRQHYAVTAEAGGCGCGSCCTEPSTLIRLEDIGEAASSIPAGADLGLSCGAPTRSAGLRPGETVLDLGSGAGVDVFLAAREVGAEGRVVGVDLTPQMVDRARRLAVEKGYANVEFRLGDIEAMPVEDSSMDVILSNCVLNLVPDKHRAFAEMYRVLKPGGRFVVSDIVSRGEVPDSIREDLTLWAGCLAGAIDQEAYVSALRHAGFGEIEVIESRAYGTSDNEGYAFFSVTLRGWKR